MMSEIRMSMAMLPKRVLLVLDDDPQVCRLMERCMKGNLDDIICVMRAAAIDPACLYGRCLPRLVFRKPNSAHIECSSIL